MTPICRIDPTNPPVHAFSYLMAIGGMACNSKTWRVEDINRLRQNLVLRFHPDKRSPHASSTLFQLSLELIRLLRACPFGTWPEDVLIRFGSCDFCRKTEQSRNTGSFVYRLHQHRKNMKELRRYINMKKGRSV